MSGWEYLVLSNAGALVHRALPIRCDSFSDALGVAQGTISGHLPYSEGLDVDSVLAPQQRIIFPQKDGLLWGAYVVTGHGTVGASSTGVPFVGRRVDVKFERTEIERDLTFQGVDQLEIARTLMRYALVNPYLPAPRAPWLRLDNTMSGKPRDRLLTYKDGQSAPEGDGYAGSRHPKVSESVQALADLKDGFDYRLGYSKDPSTGLPFATVQLGYPRHGRTEPVIGLSFPGNITDWGYAQTTDDTETYSRVYGDGVTSNAAVDSIALGQGWPLLMGSHSSTANQQDTVDTAAQAALEAHKGPNEGWQITLHGSALGTYELGDNVRLHIVNRRWPLEKHGTLRIVGHTIQPEADRIVLQVVTV